VTRVPQLVKCQAISKTRRVDTAALVAHWPIDWSTRPFCDAFVHGGNVPASHGGGALIFVLSVTAAGVWFLLSTGLTEPHSSMRWFVALPLLTGGTVRAAASLRDRFSSIEPSVLQSYRVAPPKRCPHRPSLVDVVLS
jgi:hypothetical protein